MLEICRIHFCSQEVDPRHDTERCPTEQSRNSCRMCYFCHAQLFEITDARKIKSPFLCNVHAETRKLWKRSPIRVAASRPDALHQSTNRRGCTRLVGLRPPNELGAHIKSSIALAASQCPTPRDFVPWRFSDAGRRWMSHGFRWPASETLHTSGLAHHSQGCCRSSARRLTPLFRVIIVDGPAYFARCGREHLDDLGQHATAVTSGTGRQHSSGCRWSEYSTR